MRPDGDRFRPRLRLHALGSALDLCHGGVFLSLDSFGPSTGTEKPRPCERGLTDSLDWTTLGLSRPYGSPGDAPHRRGFCSYGHNSRAELTRDQILVFQRLSLQEPSQRIPEQVDVVTVVVRHRHDAGRSSQAGQAGYRHRGVAGVRRGLRRALEARRRRAEGRLRDARADEAALRGLQLRPWRESGGTPMTTPPVPALPPIVGEIATVVALPRYSRSFYGVAEHRVFNRGWGICVNCGREVYADDVNLYSDPARVPCDGRPLESIARRAWAPRRPSWERRSRLFR